MRRFDDALVYYDSAKWALDYQDRQDKLMLSKIYQNTGNTYNDQISFNPKINLHKALVNYDKAIETSTDFTSPSKIAVFCFIKQFAYQRAKNIDSALVWIDRGIHVLAPNANMFESNINSLERTLDDSFFLLLVETKARLLKTKYESSHDIKYLLESTKYYKYRFLFHQFLVANSTSDFESLRMYALFDYGDIGAYLENIYELNLHQKSTRRIYDAFELIGIDKYGLTFKNLIKEYSETKSEDYSNYLIQKEFEKLNTHIQSSSLLIKYLPNEIISESATNIDPHASRVLFDSLYSRFSKNDVLIDFNLYIKNLYTFILTKDSISLHRHTISDSLKVSVGMMSKAMIENDPATYSTVGSKVFNEIIAPIYPLLKDKDNWLIIPEAHLGTMAFEALPRSTQGDSTTDFNSIDYLINHHSFSYALTAHSILNKIDGGKGIIGFSPTFENEDKLSSLPFSTSLIHQLESQFDGDFYFNKKATRNTLFEPNDSPKLLHIATHFKLNDTYPELTDLYCYNNNGDISALQPLDILELPYIPELTILSGCQTGIGKSFAGEGSLSFGRYFMKLGSPSIVTTLWEVDDKASKYVLSLFYNYLEEGEPKNIALHKAKLDYIASLNEHQTANPINWAGYVLIGNYDPIELDRKWLLLGVSFWYYIIGFSILLTAFFFFKKSK